MKKIQEHLRHPKFKEIISIPNKFVLNDNLKKLYEVYDINSFNGLLARQEFLNHIKNYLPLNPVCLEIGTEKGFHARMIYETLNPSKLYLVDPWEIGADKNSNTHYNFSVSDDKGGTKKMSTAHSTDFMFENLKTHFKEEGERVIFKKGFSYDMVNEFPDDYFDYIYIDATHLYDSVKADLNDYLPKLKAGGLMCGHDYTANPDFSVIPAVDEFIEENNFKWLSINLELNNDWALKRE